MKNTDKESGSMIDDNAILAVALPRFRVKRLAALMGVPLGTARDWAYGRLSASRRCELAKALIAEMDRQDIARVAARRVLGQWVGEHEVAGAGGRVGTEQGGAKAAREGKARRAPARDMGG